MKNRNESRPSLQYSALEYMTAFLKVCIENPKTALFILSLLLAACGGEGRVVSTPPEINSTPESVPKNYAEIPSTVKKWSFVEKGLDFNETGLTLISEPEEFDFTGSMCFVIPDPNDTSGSGFYPNVEPIPGESFCRYWGGSLSNEEIQALEPGDIIFTKLSKVIDPERDPIVFDIPTLYVNKKNADGSFEVILIELPGNMFGILQNLRTGKGNLNYFIEAYYRKFWNVDVAQLPPPFPLV